jgi:hypothetical protein
VALPWPDEVELLLACARREMGEADRDRARRAIERGVTWNTVIACAAAHGLVPLLNLHVSHGLIPMPPAPAAHLTARAAALTQRNLELSAELIALLRLCAGAGIAILPLKGPVLAVQVYGSVALRTFGDLDVLVEAGRVAAVRALLIRHGYRPASPEAGDMPRAVRARLHHEVFRPPSGACRIEVHDALLSTLSGRRYPLETVAGRLVDDSFMGVPARAMTPEDTFVYLAQHGGLHAWSRLEWLATLSELLRSGGVRDWPRVEAFASILHGRRRVGSAVLLADRLLGGNPDGTAYARAWQTDRPAHAANRAVIERLSRAPRRARATSVEQFMYQIRTDSGMASRVRRAWIAVTAPQAPDVHAVPLPRAVSYLGYAVRPIRLLGRFASRFASGRRPPNP